MTSSSIKCESIAHDCFIPFENGLHKITHPSKRCFLIAYVQTGRIKSAAKLAKITRKTHYNWLKADADYRELFIRSRDHICDLVNDSLVERLINGDKETIYYNGEACGHKHTFDNKTALEYLKSAGHFERFRLVPS